MRTARMKLGMEGEEKACEYLTRNGHTILERNWRSGHLEMDIISLDDKGLHFIEVKSRTAPVSASPEENVGYAKRLKLTRAAGRYLHSEEKFSLYGDYEVFFDVLSVIFDRDSVELQYFPQAFLPIY